MFPTLVQRIVLLLTSYRGISLTAGSGNDDKSRLRYRIAEELSRGYIVANLSADCSDIIANLPPEARHLIRFRFLTEYQALFDIEPVSGVIRTADVIDRDATSLCRQKETCDVNADVVLQPVQYFQVIKVTVEIIDINDNTPEFGESFITLSISESASVGSAYVIPSASDADSPQFNIQRYQIDYKTSLFSLDFSANIDGTQEVKLVLRDRLNRELIPEHRMQLFAIDGGLSSRTGSATLVVKVADVNDNRPRFTSNSYDVAVVENTPPGTMILRVQATDNDEGINGLVEYTFSASTLNSAAGRLFAIHNTSGNITVRGVIDYETATIYQLVVVARDRGHDPLSSEAIVVVRVEDLNDNAPSVTIRTLGQQLSIAEVPENAPIGSFVGHVTVTDDDSGLNGRVNCTVLCSLASGPTAGCPFTLVQRYLTEYQLQTSAQLDRERTEQYTLTVKCQDGGGGGAVGVGVSGRVSRVTEKPLRVVVTDVNDNSPVFSQQTYKGSVVENNDIGVSILQVTATDWDAGDNGRIRYSIPEDIAPRFHIDQRGVISAHVDIDREHFESFRFPVLAIDYGRPLARTGSALVHITVEDQNDERPRFLKPTYIFTIPENDPIGSTVGTVIAVDKDSAQYNAFSYSFSSGATTSELFSIDSHNGLITTRRSLDREQQAVHQFTVAAYDKKMTSMSSTVVVSVQVLDRNDNTPEFVFPGRYNNTVLVSNRVPIGQVIAQLVARDADIDQNGRIRYQLTQLAHETSAAGINSEYVNLFHVDPDRGFLIVNRRLSAFEYRVFRLNVTATDQGSPNRTQFAILNIFVNRSAPLDLPMTSSQAGTIRPSTMSTFKLVLVVGLVSFCCVVAILIIAACAMLRQRYKRRRRRTPGHIQNGGISSLSHDGDVIKPVLSNGTNHHATAAGENGDVLMSSLEGSTDIQANGSDKVFAESYSRTLPPPPPPPRACYWLLQSRDQRRRQSTGSDVTDLAATSSGGLASNNRNSYHGNHQQQHLFESQLLLPHKLDEQLQHKQQQKQEQQQQHQHSFS